MRQLTTTVLILTVAGVLPGCRTAPSAGVVSNLTAPPPAATHAAATTQDQEPATGAPADDEAAPPPIHFVAILGPGPTYVEGRNAFEQDGIEAHVLHLQKHFEKGAVVMAGPFLDDSGAMVLYQARGLKQARELATSDPSVKAGLFRVTSVKPWMVALR